MQKLGIIGAGHVGEHVIANAVKSELFGEIVVLDNREEIAFGEALDQAHATGQFSRVNVNVHEGTYDDMADADIIIVTASHHYAPDPVPEDRQVLLGNNAAIVREIMGNISSRTKEPVIIFITNPADTVVHIASTEFDYPINKIMGTGCMLDSSRLRYTVGRHYDVDPKSVSGYMMAEHGYTAFPALSRLTVSGIAFDELSDYFPDVEPLEPQDVKDNIVEAAYHVFRAKVGVTNAGVAQAGIDLARAVLLNERTVLPISTYMGEGTPYADNPVSYSTPTKVGRNGWEKQYFVTLNDWEQQKLDESLASIRANIELANELKNK